MLRCHRNLLLRHENEVPVFAPRDNMLDTDCFQDERSVLAVGKRKRTINLTIRRWSAECAKL
jgi:hypothetical protein